MQLIWGEVIKKNPWILDIIDTYFSAMANNNTGKSSTIFQERAAELNNIILQNQNYQSTRFVRSLLRGLTAGLRNLPTLHHILASEFEECALKCNNTRGKELEKIMCKLTNAENLFFVIRFCQLLEYYSITSLEGQYSSHFPIQVLARIDSTKAEIAKLGENWQWSEENLKLASIGTPKKIIEKIMNSDDKFFKPYVPVGSIRKNKDKVSDFEALLAENENSSFECLFDEEKQYVLELAGSVPIQNVSQNTLIKVERQLMSIAKNIIQVWDQRQIKTALHEKMIKTFGQIHISEDPLMHHQYMLDLLNELIDSLPLGQSELFDSNACLQGFLIWNDFWKKFSLRQS